MIALSSTGAYYLAIGMLLAGGLLFFWWASQPAPNRRVLDPDPLPRLEELARQAQQKLYADGVADGITMTLRLLLGENGNAGSQYTGERPAELERWARDTLARVQGHRE